MPPSLFTFPKPPLVHVEAYFWYLKERWTREEIVWTSPESHLTENFIMVFCKAL